MASSERTQFNDSSGLSTKSSSKSTQQKGLVPHALELKDMPVTRDSGCYTGSPMTAPMSISMSSSVPQSPATRFMFGEGNPSTLVSDVTPRQRTAYAYPFHSTPSTASSRTYSPTTGPDQFPMDSDVEDDVFIDSGIQSIGQSSGEHTEITGHDREEEEEMTSDTETDGDSSTDGEFQPVEFRLEGDSPVSSPIDIPARSYNSSHSDDKDRSQMGAVAAAASAPVGAHHLPLTRRQTVIGQFHVTERPQSGDGRMQGTLSVVHRVIEAEGPLPDVIPQYALGRSRALSESAISSEFLLRRMGTSLRDISDEFSNMTLTRQRNQLNLIQQRQQNPDSVVSIRQGNSSPSAGRRRGTFLKKFFNSPKE